MQELNSKLPGAVTIFRVFAGRAVKAFCLNSGIDGAGKTAKLNQPNRAAGKIRQLFAFAGGLNPAVDHAEYQSIFIRLGQFLPVKQGIKPVLKSFFQCWKATAGFKPQKIHNPPGFNNCKALPGECIDSDRFI